LIFDTMNMPPKYIVTIVLLFATMMGCNAFLAVRDSKVIDALQERSNKLERLECELNNNINC